MNEVGEWLHDGWVNEVGEWDHGGGKEKMGCCFDFC